MRAGGLAPRVLVTRKRFWNLKHRVVIGFWSRFIQLEILEKIQIQQPAVAQTLAAALPACAGSSGQRTERVERGGAVRPESWVCSLLRLPNVGMPAVSDPQLCSSGAGGAGPGSQPWQAAQGRAGGASPKTRHWVQS